MGVEDMGFETVQAPMGIVSEGDNSAKENGKLEEVSGRNEPIKFESHGDEIVKKEGNGVAVPSYPKDAVDEWPAPKQVHSFYFVRCLTYDDPKLKAKIEQANLEVQKKNQARSRVLEALNAKRALAQCEMTLSSLGIIRVNTDDTALAAQMVASTGLKDYEDLEYYEISNNALKFLAPLN